MIRHGPNRNRRSPVMPALLAAALTAAPGSLACDALSPALLRPALDSPDVTAPVFSNPNPPPGTEVVGASVLEIEVVDPDSDGRPGTGVTAAGIAAALIGGGLLPVSYNPPLVTVHLTGVPDGPIQVVVTARDRAGNQSVHIFNHVLDRTAPPLSFVTTPPDVLQVSDPVLPATITVEAGAEAHFAAGAIEVATPGADAVCGTADDGAAPEVVGAPTRPIPGPGTVTVVIFLQNPVPSFGDPHARSYCWKARASDSAGNESLIARQSLILWLPPPPP